MRDRLRVEARLVGDVCQLFRQGGSLAALIEHLTHPAVEERDARLCEEALLRVRAVEAEHLVDEKSVHAGDVFGKRDIACQEEFVGGEQLAYLVVEDAGQDSFIAASAMKVRRKRTIRVLNAFRHVVAVQHSVDERVAAGGDPLGEPLMDVSDDGFGLFSSSVLGD